jgi:hypothetical protein
MHSDSVSFPDFRFPISVSVPFRSGPFRFHSFIPFRSIRSIPLFRSVSDFRAFRFPVSGFSFIPFLFRSVPFRSVSVCFHRSFVRFHFVSVPFRFHSVSVRFRFRFVSVPFVRPFQIGCIIAEAVAELVDCQSR